MARRYSSKAPTTIGLIRAVKPITKVPLATIEPNKSPKVLRLEGHYDDVVLEPIAKAACKKYNTKVVAIGGVHIDNASKEEIDKIVENCKGLVECI